MSNRRRSLDRLHNALVVFVSVGSLFLIWTTLSLFVM
jgi:hypothetical protein